MSSLSKLSLDGINYSFGSNGFNLYTHSKVSNEHRFVGSGNYGVSLLTDNVLKDDTFFINGTPVNAYIGSIAATKSMPGNDWIGKWIMFVCDENNMYISGSGSEATNVSVTAIDSSSSFPSKYSTGDFAVVTETPINDVSISLNTPTTGAIGDISILIGDFSLCSAVIGSNPSIELRPWIVRQFNGESWEDKEAYFRTSNGWDSLNGIIFSDGELRTPWDLYSSGNSYVSASIQISGNAIVSSAGSTGVSMAGGFVRLSNSVSWDGIKKLHILYDKSGNNAFVIMNSGSIIYQNTSTGQNLEYILDMTKYPTTSNFMFGAYTSYNINGGQSGSAVIHRVWVE